MEPQTFVLPGESIDIKSLPSHPKLPLKIGPGLRHTPPNVVTVTVPGRLRTDLRKNAAWIEYNGSRYIPTTGDYVIAIIQRSAGEAFFASLSDYTANAILPQLSFEGASKKTRPQLASGALVYARVTLANKHMEPELECVSSSTGKSEGLGPLTGGMLFTVSLGMARRLLLPDPAGKGNLVILDEFGAAGIAFEIAVGVNGKVWIDSKNIKTTLAIGKALQETDTERLAVDAQKKLAKKLAKDL